MKELHKVKKIASVICVALEYATYQAFINASQNMMEDSDFYNLDAWISPTTRLRKDSIYLESINSKLHFSFIARFKQRAYKICHKY